jgi:NAD(P)-dependent dehydrogenase (short-subunit alcohol dehydrogenase family)
MTTSRPVALVTGVTFLDLDVTSDESVTSVVKQVITRFGRIDVLVNNAGVGSNGAAEEMRGGDDPGVVAKVIAAAATDAKPKSRYLAGSTAGRIAVLRRVVPARLFDRSIRKLNRMGD